MKFERTLNAKRNSVWGLVNKFVGLLFPFALRTVIIYSLGVEYLGLNSLFTSILSVLNLSELGVGNAIVFSMYKPIAENDYTKINALMKLYRTIYRIIGLVIFFSGILLLPLLPKLIKSDLPKDINLYALYLFYLFNSAITYWLFAYKNCLLHAYQRDDVSSKVSLVTTLLLYLVQILVIVTIKNYYLYVIAIPIFTIINNIINAIYANKLFHELKCEGKLDLSVTKDIKKRVFGLALIKIAAASRNSLGSIIISYLLGLQIVAIYNNYFYISNSIAGVLMVLTTSISSIIGESVAVESKVFNLNRMRLLNFMYMQLTGICSVLLLNLYQPFMKIWVGTKYSFPEITMILFVIYFFVSRIGDVQAQFFDASGLWWHGRLRGIIETIINLFLDIVLGFLFGVNGIVIATIVSITVINIPLSIYYVFKYYFQLSPKSFIRDQVMIMITSTLSGIVAYIICVQIPESESIKIGMMLIFLRAIITFIVFLLVFVIFYRKNSIFIQAKKIGIMGTRYKFDSLDRKD